jgi:hypothetical protein
MQWKAVELTAQQLKQLVTSCARLRAGQIHDGEVAQFRVLQMLLKHSAAGSLDVPAVSRLLRVFLGAFSSITCTWMALAAKI